MFIQVLDAFAGAASSENKPVRLAMSSLLINMAALTARYIHPCCS
jgi:hypothetical protein